MALPRLFILTLSFIFLFVRLHRLPVLLAFMVFEGCVGAYWPSIGMIKSKVVPEEVRSAAASTGSLADA